MYIYRVNPRLTLDDDVDRQPTKNSLEEGIPEGGTNTSASRYNYFGCNANCIYIYKYI